MAIGNTGRAAPPAYTLSGVELKFDEYEKIGDFTAFFTKIIGDVNEVRLQYRAHFDNLRKKNSSWANDSRKILALVGATAIVLTAAASGIRLINNGNFLGWIDIDKWLLLIAMLFYALMGALAFFERGTDRASDYFRYLAAMLAIRDVWTKFQFEVLKELTARKAAPDAAAAEKAAHGRIVELAAAACADFDKLTLGELTDWTKADAAARSMLEEAAKSGQDQVYKRLEERTKAIAKADEDAAAAAKPGYVNAIVSGAFDGEIAITVDGQDVARSPGKVIALREVKPGMRTIAATAKKGGADLAWSKTLEVKPGPQDLAIALA